MRLFNAGLRAGKTTFYEGGHRVPCWVRWPAGNLGSPRDISDPTQVQDVLPTLLDLARLPAPTGTRLDGISLAGLLRGTQKQLPERIFVVQYSRAVLTKWECAVVWNKWRLVHGTELYDVHADLAQQYDLADQQPDIVALLRDHYLNWWNDLESQVGQFVATSLGAIEQDLVSLTSSDWQDVYCDNAGHIRRAVGGPRGGPWNVVVERPGRYEIALRRWPRETGWALGGPGGPWSREIQKAHQSMAQIHGKALPVAKAHLEIQGRTLFSYVSSNEQEASIEVELSAGRTTLQAWFSDADGNDLSGAFYAYVRRLDGK